MNGKEKTKLAVVQNDVSHIKDKINKLCDNIESMTNLFTDGEQKIAVNREAIKELKETDVETRSIMWKIYGIFVAIMVAIIGKMTIGK